MTATLGDELVFRSGARAKNRVALAALTNQQSHVDGTLSDAELDFLVARAKGGFGVVCTCATNVAADGQGWPGELGVYDDRHLPGLGRLAAALRAEGALAFAQIFHGGARAPSTLTGQQPFSASAFDDPSPTFEKPRAATLAEIERVIGQFRDAARRCRDAGFDGVELHGAHGYLLGQFLSTVTNQRDDAYGGDNAGRARLLREVTRAVRAAVPASFTVGVRLSPEEGGFARGLDLDESLEVARWLAEDGVDFVHLSLWDATKNTKKRPEEHAIPLFRAVLPADVRVFAAGAVWTRADGEALLARGADVVALGRAGIANPAWPREVVTEGREPKRPPLTVEELAERAVSPTFSTYLRRFKGFVAP